jgi:competence protein ComEA
MLPEWFKEYLSFHRTERWGTIIISFLILVLIAFNIYQRVFWQADIEKMSLKYGQTILEFQRQTDSLTSVDGAPAPWIPQPVNLFNFDPNTLDSAGWVSLGFSPKQTHSILKYRNAGAKFRKPEDLKKLFMVDEAKYAELEPFIAINPATLQTTPKKEFDRPKWQRPAFELPHVELNSADTTELMKLKGIGGSFAKRIVKYRELLGGYTSKAQVLEVYGMDTVRFNPIAAQLVVDTLVRVRININTAEAKELMRHPYIDKNQAVAIVNYRQQHGAFRNISELRKIHLIKVDDLQRLLPYLKVE